MTPPWASILKKTSLKKYFPLYHLDPMWKFSVIKGMKEHRSLPKKINTVAMWLFMLTSIKILFWLPKKTVTQLI